MRIYISGLISAGGSLPAEEVERNKRRFHEAEALLRTHGHEPCNPIRLSEHLPAGSTWADYMRVDLIALMSCEVILMLPGWERSRGARLEMYIAGELGLDIQQLHPMSLKRERAS